MTRIRRKLLQGQSSNSQSNAPASASSEGAPGGTSGSQTNAPTHNVELVAGQSSQSEMNAKSSSQTVLEQSSGSAINTPTRNLELVSGQSSGSVVNAPARNLEHVPRQSLGSAVNTPTRNLELVPGQSSGSVVSALARNLEFVPGQLSGNAAAHNLELVPEQSSGSAVNTAARNLGFFPGQSSGNAVNAAACNLQLVPGQNSGSAVSAPARNLEFVPGQLSGNAAARNLELVPGQSSGSAVNAAARNLELVPGQSSGSALNAAARNLELVPGQSSRNAAARNLQLVPGQSSGSAVNAPAHNLELVPGQSSGSQADAPTLSFQAGPPQPESSTDQSVEESTDTTVETEDSDSNYSDSSYSTAREDAEEEPDEVKEWRRRVEQYTQELHGRPEQQTTERAESSRTRRAEGTSEMSLLMSPLMLHHSMVKKYLRRVEEEANVLGYVYGIVLRDDQVFFGASDSLRQWWYDSIRFEHAGPLAANLFYVANQVSVEQDYNEPAQNTYSLLMKLTDATMGALLSALMSKCDPPQRRFPFENKVAPPWWPKGDESWWEEPDADRQAGQPQYRKPHDLKKKWKAVVVISIMKHLAPKFGEMIKTVKSSKHLQDRMSVAEVNTWNSALKEEMKIYARDHPDVPLSDLLKVFQTHNVLVSGQSSSVTMHEAQGVLQQQEVTPQQQPMQHQQQQTFPMTNQSGGYEMILQPQLDMFPQSIQRRTLRFTCKNQGCPYHNIGYGFQTAALRDNHQISCEFQNSMSQIAAPGELPAYAPTVPPFNGSSQVTVPPPMHPPQHMVQPPFHPTHPSEQTVQPPFQQMYGSNYEMMPQQQPWEPFNTGSLNYPSMPSGNLDMNQLQSAFNFEGYDPDGGSTGSLNHPSMPSGNPDMNQLQSAFNFGGYDPDGGSTGGDNYMGSYTQLLNDIHSNSMLMPQFQGLDGADPSMVQHPMENFEYGAGEGSSSGVIQQPSFQPVEHTEMQLLPSDPIVETGFGDIQTDVALLEGTQFGQIEPHDGSLVPPSQPSLELPVIAIPQESNIQQSAVQEVPNPTPSGTGTDNIDIPSSPFFQ